MDNNNTYCVYVHTNTINEKQYIGITGQAPKDRWGANGNKYNSPYFKNAIKKYGWDNFRHEILETNLSLKEACELEKYYIRCLKTKEPNGYNLTDGGEGTVGWTPTEDFKQKQKIIQKEKWNNPEFREKMLAIRQDENGTYKSQEFRDKISKLVSGENNPNYQHYWTDEQKEQLRIKQRNNPIYKNENNPNAKRIMCVETGEIFECIKYAMEKYNIKTHGSITIALKYPTRTAGGMHWIKL